MNSLTRGLLIKWSRWTVREAELLEEIRRYYVGAHWQELAYARYQSPAWLRRRGETTLIRH